MTKSFSLELISRILTNIKLFLGIHLMESKKKTKWCVILKTTTFSKCFDQFSSSSVQIYHNWFSKNIKS
jgi:hypothetical protein